MDKRQLSERDICTKFITPALEQGLGYVHAEEEYAQFAARRHALLEAEGAEHNVKMLEQAAQALSKTKHKRID